MLRLVYVATPAGALMVFVPFKVPPTATTSTKSAVTLAETRFPPLSRASHRLGPEGHATLRLGGRLRDHQQLREAAREQRDGGGGHRVDTRGAENQVVLAGRPGDFQIAERGPAGRAGGPHKRTVQ